MRIDAIKANKSKKEALKYIISKMPLMSKVSQFNTIVSDIHLEYIEIKILEYEVISKEKSNKIFKSEIKKYYITMMVNTYNGYSESVDIIPDTTIKYVSKSCIKQAKIGEESIIESVKNEILNFLGEKSKNKSINKLSLQNINIKEVKSIYKPYWIGEFRGRTILVDA